MHNTPGLGRALASRTQAGVRKGAVPVVWLGPLGTGRATLCTTARKHPCLRPLAWPPAPFAQAWEERPSVEHANGSPTNSLHTSRANILDGKGEGVRGTERTSASSGGRPGSEAHLAKQ